MTTTLPRSGLQKDASGTAGPGWWDRHQDNLDRLEGVSIFTPQGVTGDFVADSTAAIQAAIDAAEAALIENPGSSANMVHEVAVVIPPGGFRITSSLVINSPLTLRGFGYQTSMIFADGNFPGIIIRARSTSDVNPEDQKPQLIDLGVTGTSDVSDVNNIGVWVDGTASGRYVPRVEFDRVLIQQMGAHGLRLDDTISVRIRNSIFTLNSHDGIHLAAASALNTDYRIQGCIIRRNQVGVYVDGNNVGSGWIKDNLFENNTAGTGDLGSSTRPGVGLYLEDVEELVVRDNYFEFHKFDIHCGSEVQSTLFQGNRHDGSSNDITGGGTPWGGTVTNGEWAAMAFEGTLNNGNKIKDCWLYLPSWALYELPILDNIADLVVEDCYRAGAAGATPIQVLADSVQVATIDKSGRGMRIAKRLTSGSHEGAGPGHLEVQDPTSVATTVVKYDFLSAGGVGGRISVQFNVSGSVMRFGTSTSYGSITNTAIAIQEDGIPYFRVPAADPGGGILPSGYVAFWLDEANDQLEIVAKESGGTVLTGNVQLA